MENVEYPGVFSRVKATILDAVVMVVLIMATTEVFSSLGNIPNYAKIIAFTFIFVLYEPLIVSLFGATVGHRMNNLKVQQLSNGKKVNLVLAILRFLLKTTLGWVSLITISSKENRQAIHDTVVRSIVVYDV